MCPNTYIIILTKLLSQNTQTLQKKTATMKVVFVFLSILALSSAQGFFGFNPFSWMNGGNNAGQEQQDPVSNWFKSIQERQRQNQNPENRRNALMEALRKSQEAAE